MTHHNHLIQNRRHGKEVVIITLKEIDLLDLRSIAELAGPTTSVERLACAENYFSYSIKFKREKDAEQANDELTQWTNEKKQQNYDSDSSDEYFEPENMEYPTDSENGVEEKKEEKFALLQIDQKEKIVTISCKYTPYLHPVIQKYETYGKILAIKRNKTDNKDLEKIIIEFEDVEAAEKCHMMEKPNIEEQEPKKASDYQIQFRRVNIKGNRLNAAITKGVRLTDLTDFMDQFGPNFIDKLKSTNYVEWFNIQFQYEASAMAALPIIIQLIRVRKWDESKQEDTEETKIPSLALRFMTQIPIKARKEDFEAELRKIGPIDTISYHEPSNDNLNYYTAFVTMCYEKSVPIALKKFQGKPVNLLKKQEQRMLHWVCGHPIFSYYSKLHEDKYCGGKEA